jgi:cellobiose-specific phosphotransferase system component IIC
VLHPLIGKSIVKRQQHQWQHNHSQKNMRQQYHKVYRLYTAHRLPFFGTHQPVVIQVAINGIGNKVMRRNIACKKNAAQYKSRYIQPLVPVYISLFN